MKAGAEQRARATPALASEPARPAARRVEGLRALAWHALRRPVGLEYRAWRSFGWMLLLLVLLELVTGGLLAVYYEPVSERAPDSLRAIARDVRWGWLVRGLHHWTGQALLLVALALGARELALGGYRGRRAGVWLAGIAFLLLVLAELVTGELLRWDAPAVALARGFVASARELPLAGEALARFLAGGDAVGPATLGRLNAVHVFLLPWALALSLVVSIWALVRLAAREREARNGAACERSGGPHP